MMKLKHIAFGLFAAASMAACDSPLDTQPRSNIPSAEALDTPEEIRVAVNGLYDAFQDNGRDFTRNQVIFPDLYADNATFSGTYSSDREVVNRNVLPTNTAVAGLWRSAYIGIDRANNVLLALESVEMDADEAAELAGEARFVRGYMYFILGRWFGGVPLITEPTREIPTRDEVHLAKSSQAAVYAFAESELRAAAAALGEERFNGRGSWGAATALLSRLNLETRDWAEAAAFATDVIESGEYELADDYAGIWRNKNSSESIFEVQYTVNDANALAFWLNPQGRQSFSPSNGLITAYTGAGDTERFEGTISRDNGTYFSKYSRVESGDDNFVMIRLAEMYANRSEALARMGTDLETAIDDINVLRERAGIAPLAATVDTAPEILTANLAERRREFALEGFRFFDLRRFSDRSDVFVGATAANTYFNVNLLRNEPFRAYFPLPQSELDSNDLLVQNTGY